MTNERNVLLFLSKVFGFCWRNVTESTTRAQDADGADFKLFVFCFLPEGRRGCRRRSSCSASIDGTLYADENNTYKKKICRCRRRCCCCIYTGTHSLTHTRSLKRALGRVALYTRCNVE